MTTTESNVPPQPPQPLTKNERTWCIFCHLSALLIFLGVPFANIIAPLVIWLIRREESPAVDQHGKAVLNFQFSMTIYSIPAVLLSLVIIGIPLLAAIVILDVVCVVVAAIKASEDKLFKYPLSIRFLK